MAKLFGVDIAGIVAKNVGPGLIAGTIQKTVRAGRDSDDPLAGKGANTPTSHGFRGIYEDFKVEEVDGSTVVMGDRKVLVILGTVEGGIEPAPGDKISLEGVTRTVQNILERDPAGASMLVHVGNR